MKNKINKLIDKSLRFHHRDIHGELEVLKNHQVKSKWYYIFWGTMAFAVVSGQLYIGTGYRIMAQSKYQFIEFLKMEFPQLQSQDSYK